MRDTASGLSRSMQDYPVRDVLRLETIREQWNASRVHEVFMLGSIGFPIAAGIFIVKRSRPS